jgi:hypothetical protein
MVLAKTLLAEAAPKAGAPHNSDDHHRAASMVEAGGHPDFLFLEKLPDKTELTGRGDSAHWRVLCDDRLVFRAPHRGD